MDLFSPLRLGVQVTTSVVKLATAVPRAIISNALGGGNGDGDRFRPTAHQVGTPYGGRAPAPPPAPPRDEPIEVTVAPPRRTQTPVRPAPPSREKTLDDTPTLAESEGSADPGAQVHVDAPWSGYDDMKAADVVDRLKASDPTVKAVVRLYEQQHKKRKSVLSATE